jgi:hypothetical protein
LWLCLTLAQDIFRRYPNQYESIIATLCDNLDSLDEPEAKVQFMLCWCTAGCVAAQHVQRVPSII